MSTIVSAPAAGDHRPATIFIVDDDALVRDSLSALLEAYGFTVKAFPDGRALLETPFLGERLCILLDLEMPWLTGLEVLAALRNRDAALPPVILMTGGKPQMAPGARTCLRKPIRPNDLLAEIRSAISAA